MRDFTFLIMIARGIIMSDRLKQFNRKIGFLTPGWWVVHLLAISIVYTLGKVLWK